jgi:dihydroorotate dehydrogenase electron transfer subunit
VSNVDGDVCEIMYAVAGKGTRILAAKRLGDRIGAIGPLGNSFGIDKPFETAVIIAGGIGVAPFVFMTRLLRDRGRKALTFLGARNSERIVRNGLENVRIATDDGSEGYRGNVVDCADAYLSRVPVADPMIFACGPGPMLKAAQSLAGRKSIPCELSLESEMACGMGICQGCPVEAAHGDRKYALVCTDGPCFDSRDIVFET